MAAAACVELMGGTPDMCIQAAALAIKFVMGLVCDPVCGLVEVPCVKRNASGSINALTAASLALAGIKSVIPPDEVLTAMAQVGQSIPRALRETSEGGLATTPTAARLKLKM
jgi:L-serine dehydratase